MSWWGFDAYLEMEGVMHHEPETLLATTNRRIAHLLASNHASEWLKAVLRTTDGHDALKILNDLKILRHLIAPLARCSADFSTRPLTIRS
jgi:hypothetical protein